jgi:hypothetical protein
VLAQRNVEEKTGTFCLIDGKRGGKYEKLLIFGSDRDARKKVRPPVVCARAAAQNVALIHVRDVCTGAPHCRGHDGHEDRPRPRPRPWP